jgi:hypothetical protein
MVPCTSQLYNQSKYLIFVSSLTFFMSYVLDFNDSEKIMVDGQYHQFYNIVVK